MSNQNASLEPGKSRLPGGLKRLGSRFRKDRRGVAAIEFALLVPVMLIMYVGTVEITEAFYVDRRITLVTRVSGDLVARDQITNQPLSFITDKVRVGLNPMEPAKMTGLAMRITAYGVDQGGPASAARAFVDWQVTCNVTAYTIAAGPTVTCGIGTSAPFTGGLPRCAIDPSIATNVMRTGTPLIRVETQFNHIPILAGLFSGGGAGWFNFIAPGGFNLSRSYFTWPRPNTRPEGPNNAAMATKSGVSSNQTLDPSNTAVCASTLINPVGDRFVP
jgi:Flp pilus assembly protein TadG